MKIFYLLYYFSKCKKYNDANYKYNEIYQYFYYLTFATTPSYPKLLPSYDQDMMLSSRFLLPSSSYNFFSTGVLIKISTLTYFIQNPQIRLPSYAGRLFIHFIRKYDNNGPGLTFIFYPFCFLFHYCYNFFNDDIFLYPKYTPNT